MLHVIQPAMVQVLDKGPKSCALGNGSRWRHSVWHSVEAALILFATCLQLQIFCSAQVKEIRRVLILNDLGTIASPGFAEIDQALLAGLRKSPYHIELYQESLELTLFSDEVSQHRFREEFVRKYADRKLDLIIAAGSDSLKFFAESHERFIRDTPTIFCTLLWEIPDQLRPDMHFTGVLGRLQPEETLSMALRLLPGTKHVVVTGGMGKFDYRWEAIAKQSFHNYESKLDFTYLTDLTMPTLLERLRHLPNDTIVYHTAITQDAAGERFIDSAEAVPLVASAANAPVFVMDDVDLRGGTVGGDLVNWADDARIAAGMAVRVLNGERPRDIPVVVSNNAYMFDWRALKRWGMKESDLPSGSIVLNRQPSFWEMYKQYFLVTIFILLAQTAAILGLLWQRARRRKSEAELRRSEEKFSKSFRQSPLAITITRVNDGCYLDVNETFENQTGWKRDEVIGRSPLDINLWVDPSQRSLFMNQLLAAGRVRDFQSKFCRKDAQIRIGLGSAELIDVNGEPCVLAVIADVTERKMAEEALASLSGRLIDAQEAERTRIARELHDDINQRLAIVAVNLRTLKEELPASEGKMSRRIEEVCERVSDLENDVQALSHRLHSSKLEYLGLEAAAKGLCMEFSDREDVKIDFRCDDVPETVPYEVSLCLFRVLQEALHNAVKYSGVREFEVSFNGEANEVHLRVRDSGIGFDLNVTRNGHGLGLTSMKERLRLVNGQLFIDSKPQHGTTIIASVPLDASTTTAGGGCVDNPEIRA